MSKELIRIVKNSSGNQVVSAKELYLGLGMDIKKWSRWRETNIVKNDFFFENKDWVVIPSVGTTEKGGQTSIDFAISLDFAKHLAMMSRTKKSHEYRNYFIQCEKELLSLTRKDELYIKIGRAGGSQALIASNELVELEVSEAVAKEKDGNNKILTCGQVVDELEIYGLTTLLLHEYFCSVGLGDMSKMNGQKRRYFQPSKKFEEIVAKCGYSYTGTTEKRDKVKVVYSTNLVEYISDNYYSQLKDYVESTLGLKKEELVNKY